MISRINFGTGLYISEKAARKAKEKTLEKIDKYAQETNSDIFITSVNEKSPKGTSLNAVTAKNGKVWFQTFIEPKVKVQTRDLYNTKIAGDPVKKEEDKQGSIADIKEITFKNGIAVLKNDGSVFSGLAVKAKEEGNNLMILKILDGKIVSSKIVDNNNNVVSGHIYSYDGDKLIHTIKCTPDHALFIEHNIYRDNSTVLRDENYTPKKLVQYYPEENETVITEF